MLGYNILEDLAPGADEAHLLVQLLPLEAALVVDPVAVPAEDHLATHVAVEAVPVVPLKRQHVLGGQAVGVLLHTGLVTYTKINTYMNTVSDNWAPFPK